MRSNLYYFKSAFLILLMTGFTTVLKADDNALIHFFYFNADMPNNIPLTEYDAWYSFNDEGSLSFESALEGYPFDSEHDNWRLASMERRNSPTDINYRIDGNNNLPYNSSDMRGMQVRNPFSEGSRENTLIFHVPSTGFEDVIFELAAMDEGGADGLIIDYSVASGDPEWIATGLSETEYDLTEQYSHISVDFSGIAEANENEDFKIRVRFRNGVESEEGTERVTFNNITLAGVPTVPPSYFYSSSSGSLADLSTWGSNENGSGDNPDDFSSDFQIFVIQNRTSVELDEAWMVSGRNSAVVVGEDVSLTLPFEYSLTGTLELEDNASLDIKTHFLPVIGQLGDGSSVTYSQQAGEIAILPAEYHHLVITGANKYFNNQGIIVNGTFEAVDVGLRSTLTSGRAEINLLGDLSFDNVSTHTSFADRVNLKLSGNQNQELATDGAELHVYNFMANKSAGSITFSANSIIRTDNHFEMHLTDDASFDDGGNNLFVNNSLSLGGETSAYNLSGTFLMTGDDDGNNQNLRGNPDDNDIPIAAELNNLTILGTQSEVRFRPNSGTENIIINGNLTIAESARGVITFYENNIHVGGDYNFHPSPSSETYIDDTEFQIIFDGNQNQSVDAGTSHLNAITVDKSSGDLTLAGDLNIMQSLTLSSGNIITGDYDLSLSHEADIHEGSSDSYIIGNLNRAIDGERDEDERFKFPVGTTEGFQPVALTHMQNPNPVSIRIQAFEGPTGGSGNSGLQDFNDDIYWHAEVSAGENFLNGLRIELPVDNPTALSRVVRSATETGSYGMAGGDVEINAVKSISIRELGYFTTGTALSDQFTLSLNVVDLDDQPIEGATVEIDGNNYTTDASGVAEISDLSPNLYYAEVSASGHDRFRGNFEVTGSDASYDVILEDPRYDVTFTITDGADPIQNAEVVIGDQTTLSSVSGVAVFRLADGDYSYSIDAGGYLSESGTFSVAGGNLDITVSLEVATSADDNQQPYHFELSQNYPNPFNPTTVINYQLPVNSEVRLEVFDMLGRKVAILVNEHVSAGRHEVTFDASQLSSGIYIYRIIAGEQIQTKTMTLVK